LALDSEDRPRIAYRNWLNGDLKYTARDGGATYNDKLVTELTARLRDYESVAIDVGSFAPQDVFRPIAVPRARRAGWAQLRKATTGNVGAVAVATRGDAFRIEIIPSGDHGPAIAAALEAHRSDVLAALDHPLLTRTHTHTQFREVAEHRRAERVRGEQAWKRAVIEYRDGLATLSTQRLVAEEDRGAVERYQTWRRQRERAAATIVTSLINDATVAEADLVTIGGDYLLRLHQRGYRAFFEGDWHCERNGERRRYRFQSGAAHLGDMLLGRYGYEMDRAEKHATLRVGDDGMELQVRVSDDRIAISDAPPAGMDELSCTRIGEAPEEPAIEDEIVLQPEVPKPMLGADHTFDDLRAVGLRVDPIGDGQTLVCAANNCVCFSPLACDEERCNRFEDNVQVLRNARAGVEPDGSKSCDRAHVGRCGDLRYFGVTRFAGDAYPFELRWFDSSGAMVAERSFSDYPAYCNRSARFWWHGRIPYCPTTQRDELLCGEGLHGDAPPMIDLMELLGSP
jgi:hypothetical protein